MIQSDRAENLSKLHAAIETAWSDKRVRRKQSNGHDGVHIVKEFLWDEKGALHCKDEEGYWTPASELELDE